MSEAGLEIILCYRQWLSFVGGSEAEANVDNSVNVNWLIKKQYEVVILKLSGIDQYKKIPLVKNLKS